MRRNSQNPVDPIENLWPQKMHDDWSNRREVTDTLTPYNWTMVQRVKVGEQEIFVPRRCMHRVDGLKC